MEQTSARGPKTHSSPSRGGCSCRSTPHLFSATLSFVQYHFFICYYRLQYYHYFVSILAVLPQEHLLHRSGVCYLRHRSNHRQSGCGVSGRCELVFVLSGVLSLSDVWLYRVYGVGYDHGVDQVIINEECGFAQCLNINISCQLNSSNNALFHTLWPSCSNTHSLIWHYYIFHHCAVCSGSLVLRTLRRSSTWPSTPYSCATSPTGTSVICLPLFCHVRVISHKLTLSLTLTLSLNLALSRYRIYSSSTSLHYL